jgi:hypothetical protein
MEQVKVDEPRDTVPAWARPQQAATKRMASQKQLDYLLSLIQQKDLSVLSEERQAKLRELESTPTEFVHETTHISFDRVKEMLDTLIPLKKAETFGAAQVALVEVPAGRYAVEADNGELRFYKKWVSRDGKRHYIFVQHGQDESKLPLPAMVGVAKKILKAGVRECAIRYGLEIGACSNCGRRLTNRISRELGIGPVCGGRMWGDDGWKDEVKTKRQEILARGEDPDEELSEEMLDPQQPFGGF